LPISVDIQQAVAHDETIRKDITAEAVHVEYDDGTEDLPNLQAEIIDAQEEN
jgi:recombinational DNA repair protein RecT